MRVTLTGQACPICHTPVIKRWHHRATHFQQRYWFKWWFECPKCLRRFMVEAAKVINEDYEKVIDFTGKIIIHTDGACSGNPGPGGYAAILQYNGHERVITGRAALTTNNIMELRAVIVALEAVKYDVPIQVITDSDYVRSGITEWIKRWKVNGWRTSSGKPVKNFELWQQLDVLNMRHHVEWAWVKGHSREALNERCDVLACEERDKAKGDLFHRG